MRPRPGVERLLALAGAWLAACGAARPAASSTDACEETSRLPRQEGDCCGGPEQTGCADGLTCYRRYRTPDSIGTCMAAPRAAPSAGATAPEPSSTAGPAAAPSSATVAAGEPAPAPGATCAAGAWCELGRPATGLRAVSAQSATEVWAVGDETQVHRLLDGSWTGGARRLLAGRNRVASLLDVDSDGAGTVVAVGTDGIVLHVAPTEVRVGSGTESDLLAVHVVGPSEAYAVGNAGAIVRWDGGRWTAERSGVRARLHAVTSHGGAAWAAGERGTVLERSRDTGRWRPRRDAPALSFRGACSDGQVLYLAADDGQVARFDGRRWTTERTGVEEPLEHLDCSAEAGPWAAARSGVVVGRRADGWARVARTSGAVAGLAVAGTTVVALGDDGFVLALRTR